MVLLDVTPDLVGIASFVITFLLLLGTILFFRHSKKELSEIGTPARKKNLRHIEQRSELAESLMMRLDEKQKELFQLQARFLKMENKVDEVNQLSMEIEELRSANELLLKEKHKREHKIAALATENEELREENYNLQQDLSEMNAEKQQLQKKIGLLKEMEAEWQMMAEKNQQLQTKVRRIGELESLLSIMKEEKSTGSLS